MKNLLIYSGLLVFFFLSSCSSERNTWASKAYHNTTAHFNGYYYALEEINKVEDVILTSHVDDYNRILTLFPAFDSTLAKGFDKEIQEAIKMASIAIQRHPNSKWVDDAYILVGKARMYSLDWGNAIQTFKFVNTNSKDRDAKHLAILNLARTYIEHREMNNAQAALDYLQKANLSKANKKKFFLEKAYFHQIQEDHDQMVRNLTAADDLLSKKDRRGRIYFIIGQVYQELGFESEAYNYYKKCLNTNPEYEVDFYARLYMAQVTEITRNRDVNAARKSFRKLLKDSKNKEFKDKIYYEMGIFELKQNDIKEAIHFLNRSVRSGNNMRIQGEAYLKLGEIYYDSLKNYELSQAYYDSAISALPSDYEGYASIKARQEILNEFVGHLKTVQWQDSLLVLATLDSAALRIMVDSVVTAERKLAELKAGKQKKRRNRVEIETVSTNTIFNNDEGATEVSGDWYFGNPASMAAGQSEFKRVWGNIKLEDNWRRSQRSSTFRDNTAFNNTADSTRAGEASAQPAADADPVEVAFASLSSEIPRTDEAKQAALGKIEDAYFHLGDIYNFKLQEKENAVDIYTKLLTRFPNSEYEAEVLYTLYLIRRETDSTQAETYAQQLIQKHPNSTFTKILLNPDYLQESSQVAEKQKAIYKEAYQVFEGGHYDSAGVIVQNAMQLGETSFYPTLRLLQILIVGETEDITTYQYALQEYIKTYPETEQAQYAQKLLETSRQFVDAEEKRKGIQYISSFDAPHYFVLVYTQQGKINELTASALERFNDSHFSQLSLKTSHLVLNDELALTFVSDLPGKKAAMEYFQSFTENLSGMRDLRNHKFDNFVITKDNFDIFYRTKGLNEYLRFFEKNYQTKNP
ncbi:MAG TPA: tetratricopeptide repeat protein [Chryseosolibacter sp.]|nr:tetratricopeptide repeat protein [Chryseosolibacter sp.]